VRESGFSESREFGYVESEIQVSLTKNPGSSILKNERLSLIPLYGATIECVSFEVGDVCGSLSWAAKSKLDCSQCYLYMFVSRFIPIKDREISL